MVWRVEGYEGYGLVCWGVWRRVVVWVGVVVVGEQWLMVWVWLVLSGEQWLWLWVGLVMSGDCGCGLG